MPDGIGRIGSKFFKAPFETSAIDTVMLGLDGSARRLRHLRASEPGSRADIALYSRLGYVKMSYILTFVPDVNRPRTQRSAPDRRAVEAHPRPAARDLRNRAHLWLGECLRL